MRLKAAVTRTPQYLPQKSSPGKAANALDSLIFPNICPACKKDLVSTKNAMGLCETCGVHLTRFPIPRCKACGGPVDGLLDVCGECAANPCREWDHAVSVYPYGGFLRHLIHRFKYRGAIALAPGFARAMADNLQEHGVIQPDAVTAVPMHWWRQLQRGYNQAELLARLIASITGIPLIKGLRRTKNSQRQATLDLKTRQRNVQQVFSHDGKTNLKGYHIVLVDDVLTTGATLDAATLTLRKAGAEVVEVLTLARG